VLGRQVSEKNYIIYNYLVMKLVMVFCSLDQLPFMVNKRTD